MKRRGFLGLFGATVATPFLPSPVMGTAVRRAVPYSAAALHGAIYHAKSRAVFSVWGLARALNLPLESAEVLMGDLAKRGVVGPMQGTTFGGRWASSKIMTTDAVAATNAARRAKTQATHKNTDTRRIFAEPDLTKMMAHLQQLCRLQGMTLSPRCATP